MIPLQQFRQNITEDTSLIIGVEWDTASSSTALRRIDVNGNTVTRNTAWFNAHPTWGKRRRCILSADGVPTFGTNARGDGLTLDGSTGQVMVSQPAFYIKAEKVGAKIRWWISPTPYPGFVAHPWFSQRSGIFRNQAYIGAYLAALRVTSAGVKYLLSASGKMPISGSEIVELSFSGGISLPAEGDLLIGATSGVSGTVISSYGTTTGKVYLKLVDERVNFNTGSVALTVGQTVTGTSSGATGTIVAVVVSSGSWGAGTAAGYLVIRSGDYNFMTNENVTDPLGGAAKATDDGSAKAAFTNGENLHVSGSTIMVAASTGSALGFTCQNAETYANNIGSTRWGCEDIWALDATTILFLIEYANWNSQSTSVGLGKGVVNKSWARRFNGENTGSGSADTQIATNSTGKATGTDGVVHVVYRGMEDPWGNLWRFIIGWEAVDTAYQILKRNGTGVPASPMTVGTYESTIAAPYTYDVTLRPDGYSKDILFEDLTKYLIIPNLVGGSSTTYLCDYFWGHRPTTKNLLLAGGRWAGGAYCGVGCRVAFYDSSFSTRDCGCWLEFV